MNDPCQWMVVGPGPSLWIHFLWLEPNIILSTLTHCSWFPDFYFFKVKWDHKDCCESIWVPNLSRFLWLVFFSWPACDSLVVIIFTDEPLLNHCEAFHLVFRATVLFPYALIFRSCLIILFNHKPNTISFTKCGGGGGCKKLILGKADQAGQRQGACAGTNKGQTHYHWVETGTPTMTVSAFIEKRDMLLNLAGKWCGESCHHKNSMYIAFIHFYISTFSLLPSFI